jgi:hypothetical protein
MTVTVLPAALAACLAFNVDPCTSITALKPSFPDPRELTFCRDQSDDPCSFSGVRPGPQCLAIFRIVVEPGDPYTAAGSYTWWRCPNDAVPTS